ncbi:type II toxin-antitoxin system HicA family toxin [Cyanobium sp. Candia 9D4]|uniref:type II toxin-antitoxin system HicA family toxin n=1 Tax=Cyanobium sp. Candia 9D4 TaxID=2823707 RepID=UPI0020CF968F|nr:type II toxin-antitoxin system HicA family toxin [Cyanobium sp. Candia 9D4]MCP9934023.1 type II toxin-antitoxin system HicA family toxin [Cyanobium sp. Candia 9D4]
MPKLPHVSGRDIIRTLELLGFEAVRQNGSHVVMRCGSRGCVVPLHKSVKIVTLAGLLRQAKVDVSEFLDRL